ncbi:hypothetical protein [Corynebacterium marinum]|uniref:Uncharacterized protein n=1 Tax=Corynebacterium marinum DSM 44953 TaxID=1224162 RepID=A0A0B6TI26_9CORY|nr:hypothetical protein [Corynebacterium marinum]AJK69617.1 hypothetical protein B840_10165 [Corynebacterium marinum DSM 44953]GGO22709.1 hypothetical protein GCM10010980_25020 [Corynebacterium marinum]
MTTDPKNPDQQPTPIADPDGRPGQQPTDVPQPEDRADRDSFDHKVAENPPRDDEV